MNKPTHTVKLRNGKAAAEPVTEAELATMKKVLGTRMSDYEVTPIAEEAPKPALAAKAAKSNSDTPAPE